MEIEEQEPLLSPSRKKHRSPSPNGGAASAGEPKRRKHHHHRHQHCHCHHSKKDKEKEEGDENREDILEDGNGEGVSDHNRMGVDGELEDGEILEEGEIKPELANSAFSGEDRSYSDKELKSLDSDSDALHRENKRSNARDLMNHETSVEHCEIPSRKIEAVPRFGDANVTEGKSSVIVGESEVSKNTHAQKKYPINKDDDDACSSDLRSGSRSISPFSGPSLCAMKHKDGEENNETASDHSLGRHRNREDMIHSPSHRRHHRDVHHKDRSRSRDTDYDRGNRDDRPEQNKFRSRPSDAEVDRESEERERSISNSRHDDREEKPLDYDREKEMDRGVHMGRERSASYRRHDRRESRHSDPDRERDMKKEHRRKRDTSSSISSWQDWGRGMRERDRGSVRDRDMEKPINVNRERYRERNGSRDVYRERERDRYGYDKDRSWTRDRKLNLDTEREYVRQVERDRVHERNKQRDFRHSRYDEWDQHRDRTRSNEIAKEPTSARLGSQEGKSESLREEDEEDYQEKIEQQLAKQDEKDLEKIKESRKRRQAILEKYKQQQLQKLVESPSDGDLKAEDKESMRKDKQWGLDTKSSVGQALINAKRNPSDVYVSDPSFIVGKSPIHNGVSTPERNNDGAGGLGEGIPKSETSADMFCDDIFGESLVGIRKLGKWDGPQIERSGLHDNWDDVEGYYSYRFGEVLDGRYEVIAAHGKGVFSTVVRAKDLKGGMGEPVEVAIKIIRSNETMYKIGQEELKLLVRLAAADPEDRKHCVRFLSSFKYRNHLCLVFESLHMNLREVLKKYGRNIGLKLTAVRTYAQQLFIALKHLKTCGVLHCDIKPDNMLVNEGKNVLKLCDFGNAMSMGKHDPTPYLVSRFYRAPEIILGLEYDHPMDMWSVGCCLYELFCGKVLSPGPSNNDMLRLHMELKGSFPKKMLKKGLFTHQHFDHDYNFHAIEEDPVSRKTVTRVLPNIKPRDISTLISSSPGEDPKMVANFKDLLERIFVLDPDKRITVAQARNHPFITGK